MTRVYRLLSLVRLTQSGFAVRTATTHNLTFALTADVVGDGHGPTFDSGHGTAATVKGYPTPTP